MSLTVCLVTRNEEPNLPRVLGSVAGVADEVIVADTGSADRTAELAAQLGAKVHPFAWGDDFAAARNYALDQARGDWILWLNPDEELLATGRPALAACLQQSDVLGYAIPVQEWTRPELPEPVFAAPQPRLFRRDPSVRYVGRLHPHFEIPLEELAHRRSLQVRDADVPIRRHAYLSVVTPDKLRWAARLLELELRDRPGDLHYLIEYGRTLLWLNDPRGHEILAEAVERLLPQRAAPLAPTTTVGSLLEYLLTVAPGQTRSRLTAVEARELALRWFPRTPPLLWALANQSFQAGDYAGAARRLEELIGLGREGTYDRSAAFDLSILHGPAMMNLGVCYLRLGELDKAAAWFGQLLTHPLFQARAREHCDLVQRLRQPPRG